MRDKQCKLRLKKRSLNHFATRDEDDDEWRHKDDHFWRGIYFWEPSESTRVLLFVIFMLFPQKTFWKFSENFPLYHNLAIIYTSLSVPFKSFSTQDYNFFKEKFLSRNS
jgi:hypothetical protein